MKTKGPMFEGLLVPSGHEADHGHAFSLMEPTLQKFPEEHFSIDVEFGHLKPSQQ